MMRVVSGWNRWKKCHSNSWEMRGRFKIGGSCRVPLYPKLVFWKVSRLVQVGRAGGREFQILLTATLKLWASDKVLTIIDKCCQCTCKSVDDLV